MNAIKGKRVLVTRPEGQAHAFVTLLEDHGAIPLLMPAIRIRPAANPAALRATLAQINDNNWVVFTSVNGVIAVAKYLPEIPNRVKVAAIGPSTAKAVADQYRHADVVPDEYISDAIAPALGNVKGKRILLARADIARRDLAIQLRRRGALVTEVAAYKIENNVPSEITDRPDFITVTSSSGARGTVDNLKALGREEWISSVPWVCIGPITATTAQELGCHVAAVAEHYTIEGMMEALIAYASNEEAAHA